MIGTTKHQSALFYVAFGNEASLIKDDLLDPMDAVLEDPSLIERVADQLGKRAPRSRTMGRRGISPDRLLRCAVLKHIKQWSFRELEREVPNPAARFLLSFSRRLAAIATAPFRPSSCSRTPDAAELARGSFRVASAPRWTRTHTIPAHHGAVSLGLRDKRRRRSRDLDRHSDATPLRPSGVG